MEKSCVDAGVLLVQCERPTPAAAGESQIGTETFGTQPLFDPGAGCLCCHGWQSYQLELSLRCTGRCYVVGRDPVEEVRRTRYSAHAADPGSLLFGDVPYRRCARCLSERICV